MGNRFDQARVLIADAKKLFAELASAEMYEQILEADNLPDDFPLGVYKLLVGLRSALEYSLREIHSRCVAPQRPLRKGETVTFPISPKGLQAWAKHNDFVKWVHETKVPGLNTLRPDIMILLRSFQQFADPIGNEWFPDFALLSNDNKHDQFDPSMALVKTAINIGGVFRAVAEPGRRGIGVIHNCAVNGKKTGIIVTDGRSIWNKPNWDQGLPVVRESQVVIRFNAIGRDVVPFIRHCVGRVENIVDSLNQAVGP